MVILFTYKSQEDCNSTLTYSALQKHGEYSLSTRCIMEMDTYIRMMYMDQVKVCHICHNIALQVNKGTPQLIRQTCHAWYENNVSLSAEFYCY